MASMSRGGYRTCAFFMNSVQIGRADFEPSMFRSELSSNPTQTITM